MKRALQLCVLAAALVTMAFATGGHTVSQKDKAFSQTSITVNRGDTITFRNDDSVVHNVFSSSAGTPFNLRAQQPGASASVTFNTPGTVEVRCAIHPSMKLTVNVR